MRRAGWHKARRWGVALLVALPGLAIAQEHEQPYFFPVEVVHAQGVREIETVISRASWHLLGRDPEGYRIGLGKTEGMTSERALALQTCNDNALRGHGSLERTIPAEDYAGGRVRVTGRVKRSGGGIGIFYVNLLGPGGAHLHHVRLYSAGGGKWESLSLVMDLRKSIVAFDIGVALWDSDASTVWLEGVTVEAVDGKVPLNGQVVPNIFISGKSIVSCDGLKDGVREP